MERKEWQGKLYEKQGEDWVEIAPEATSPQADLAPPQEPDQFSTAESAIQGIGEGATLGYLPKLQALSMAALHPELTYQKALEQMKKRSQAIVEEDPLAYGAGAMVGGSALPGGAAAKGATMLTRAARAVGTGAALGGLAETGDVPDQMDARLKQAGMGALIGGAGQGIGAALSGAGKALKTGRQQLAFKLAGARKKHYQDIAKFKIGDQMEDFMQKEGMLTPGQTFETALEKSTAIVEDAGAKIGNTYSQISGELADIAKKNPGVTKELAKTSLNARQVTAKILARARSELKGKAGGQQALQRLRQELQNLKDLDRTKIKRGFEMSGITQEPPISGLPVPTSRVPGIPGQIPPAPGVTPPGIIEMADVTRISKETPFEKLLDYRQSLDDVIKYDKTFSESPANLKALRVARDMIKEKLDARIAALDKHVKTDRVQELKKLNERYRMAKNVQKISQDRAAGEAAKVNLGLLETIAGTGYAASQIAQGQDPLKAIGTGIVGGLALRQARKYGPGMAYQTVRGAEALSRPVRALGQVPQGAYVVPWTLMNREK